MIYAITERDNRSVVKIGYTATPGGSVAMPAVGTRLSTLQTSNWRELVCVAVANGNQQAEQDLHARFSSYRVRGEWFANQGAVASWIREHQFIGEILKRKRGPKRRRPAKSINTKGWRVVRLTDADHPFNVASRGLILSK